MKRILLLLLAVILIVSGLFLLMKVAQIFGTSGQGALQVTANVKSNVYLGDTYLGTTPVCKCKQGETVTEGEYTVRVEPQDKNYQPFTAKVKVNPGVLTAVERTFLPGSLASAYTLTLEKVDSPNAQLMVASLPKDAMVTIDDIPTSVTPLLQEKITPSEHEVEIHKNGFAKKTIRVRTVSSYRLIIDVILGAESNSVELTTPTPPATTATPSPTGKVTPSPSPTSQKDTVTVLNTGVGFLRVRENPTTSSEELGRVSPGDTFDILDEQSGWYKIEFEEGEEGWVSGQFVEEN